MLHTLRIAITVLASTATALAGEGWMVDYDQALARAKSSDRDLLLLFTQSDAPACRKLETAVYADERFISAVSKDYVLVRLDFPSTRADGVATNAASERLRRLYLVEELPVTVQTTSDGSAYWVSSPKVEYDGPDHCARWIANWKSMGKPVLTKALTLVAAYEQADGASRWGAWDKLLTEFDEALWPWHARALEPAIRSAIVLDPDNKLGKQRKALEVLLRSKCSDEATRAAAERLDPKNALGLKELLLAEEVESTGAPFASDGRSIEGDEEFLAWVASRIEQQQAALKKVAAFAKAFGFRDKAVGFRCYWQIAFVAHNVAVASSEMADAADVDENTKRELGKCGKTMLAIGKDAARKAKALGRHEEPTEILDELLAK